MFFRKKIFKSPEQKEAEGLPRTKKVQYVAEDIKEITARLDESLEAILKLMPLDAYVDSPVSLMQVISGDAVKTPIWDEYKEIVKKYDSRGEKAFIEIERFKFYEEAKTAYAIVATGETAIYANIMIQKGVVVD